ncbi:hypothetical protein QA612_16615 [Evansella sp. AB-P1]|uniref:hypothetical protein n=1 Tax=Evansella sp. AB-P1 TaxID=3037653 RepID=UPI00241C1D52|nr:hypothetical protein [Evansella sp. AB-P1]MDG5789081.1 hypothetical protein [Evansella sp. AB-P1]
MFNETMKIALFIGVFVGIIVFIQQYIFPQATTILSVIIASSSAIVGGLISFKLFRKK